MARAAAEAAARLGDARLAALAADFDRALRRLASGTLSDPAALDLLRALGARAADAARAAQRDSQATEAAERAFEANAETRSAGKALAQAGANAGDPERASAALGAGAAAHPTETARALASAAANLAAAAGKEGPAGEGADAKDQPRRLARDGSRTEAATEKTAGDSSDPEARHLEQLRRDLDDTASACRTGDPGCRQRAEERGRELEQLGRQGAARESLQRLERSAEQLRARVSRGELGEDDAQATRRFARAAKGKTGAPGGTGDGASADAEAAAGNHQGPGSNGPGDDGDGQGHDMPGTKSGAQPAAASAAMAAEGAGASQDEEGNGNGIGHQPGGAPLGARRGDPRPRAWNRDRRRRSAPERGRTGTRRGDRHRRRAWLCQRRLCAHVPRLRGRGRRRARRDRGSRGKALSGAPLLRSDPPATASARRGERPVSASRPNDVDLDAAAITAAVAAFRADLDRLLSEIGRRLVGQTDVVDAVASALLAGGHVLLEGVPGLGKTLLVRTLAEALDLTLLAHPVHARSHAGRHRSAPT